MAWGFFVLERLLDGGATDRDGSTAATRGLFERRGGEVFVEAGVISATEPAGSEAFRLRGSGRGGSGSGGSADGVAAAAAAEDAAASLAEERVTLEVMRVRSCSVRRMR